MVDLVERLKRGRWYNDDDAADLMAHAAAELESLRARLADKDKALEPFALLAGSVFRVDEDGREMNRTKPDNQSLWGVDGAEITYGDLRRAREAWGGEDV
jgi:hypothetical protein